MGQKFRILSLDGGGIRGVISAYLLAQLERRLGEPLYRCFDLIAGTSTGSLAACGLGLGIEAEKILSLYLNRARDIFPGRENRLWRRTFRLFARGLRVPKYDGEGLKRTLREVFGDSRLQDSITPVMVIAYETTRRRVAVFKSFRSEHSRLKIHDVCAASCSAPSYFPAHPLQVAGSRALFIDGGIVANNPAACAVAEAVRINSGLDAPVRLEDFVLASFGTGRAVDRISLARAAQWGPLQWAIPIIGLLFDGSADSAHYIVGQLLNESRYFRFQIPISAGLSDLDNPSRENVDALIAAAEKYLKSDEGGRMMDRLVTELRIDRDARD